MEFRPHSIVLRESASSLRLSVDGAFTINQNLSVIFSAARKPGALLYSGQADFEIRRPDCFLPDSIAFARCLFNSREAGEELP
jgi:hypothetical protein